MSAKKPSQQAQPNFQDAVTLFQHGRLDQAKALCEAIRKGDPQHFDALYLLGILHSRQGQTGEALRSLEAASKLRPADLAVLSDLGVIYAWLGRFADALAICDKALAIKPDHVDALVNRGNALLELKRPAEAVASYDQALARRPQLPDTLYNRGTALMDMQQPGEALASYDKALALQPGHALAWGNRGNALTDLNRPAEAQASYEKAIALKPDYAEAYNNKGILLTELGQFDAGIESIKTAITLAPKTTRYYYHLTAAKRMTPDDPHLRAMEQLAEEMPALGPDAQIHLQFGLGKALADIDKYERAFRHLLDGNALKRKHIAYDEAEAIGTLERMCAAFTEDHLRGTEGTREPSNLPVFIIGLPRSGSTLIEQILSSHASVFGAGQTNVFSGTLRDLFGEATGKVSPEGLSRLSPAQLSQLGTNYLDRIRSFAPAAAGIIDKTLENFPLAGLIHMVLPNARIIHTRRGAMDTCVSCFSTLFGENHRLYTYDLAELGRYFRAYEAMMSHWRSVLPPGVMLEVQYEEVVADLEGETRRILAHCGLNWDARCLDFHKTQRSVRTASKAQVRDSLFTSSIGRWRKYEPYLGPLRATLDPSR